MKGLITKELIMLKKQLFALSVLIITFSAASIWGELSFCMVIPMFLSIFSINSLTVDEQSKWQQYSISLPYSRKIIVSSKYVTTIIVLMISVLVLTVCYFISGFVHSEHSIKLSLLISGGLLTGTVYPILFFPLALKLSSLNGRTVLFIINAVFGGILGALACTFLDSEFSSDVSVFSRFEFLPLIILAVVIVLYLISWIISIKIYEKRDL